MYMQLAACVSDRGPLPDPPFTPMEGFTRQTFGHVLSTGAGLLCPSAPHFAEVHPVDVWVIVSPPAPVPFRRGRHPWAGRLPIAIRPAY